MQLLSPSTQLDNAEMHRWSGLVIPVSRAYLTTLVSQCQCSCHNVALLAGLDGDRVDAAAVVHGSVGSAGMQWRFVSV